MSIEGREGAGDVRHPHLSPGYTYDGEPAQSDLSALKVDELRALADERGVDHEGLKKADLLAALGG